MSQAPKQIVINDKENNSKEKEVVEFTPDESASEVLTLNDLEIQTQVEEFTDLQLEDYTWKVRSRKLYGAVLVSLLFLQNIAVFGLVGYAIVTNKITDLQIIFSILVAATLTETAYMVKVIIEWLFRDIDYPEEQ